MMTTMTVRLDEEMKRQAADVASGFGLDLSSITRAFIYQVANSGSIPLSLNAYEPNDESLEAIVETEQMIAAGQRRFDCLGDMLEALKG